MKQTRCQSNECEMSLKILDLKMLFFYEWQLQFWLCVLKKGHNLSQICALCKQRKCREEWHTNPANIQQRFFYKC